ncbi:MAG: glutamine--fructose-6-phosphate transaminase (isomerizing) [Candidatus Bathyarchaeia archaeon]
MCGIFGCISRNRKVAAIILDSLKRLEYRGYDSVGQATIHEGKLFIKKDVGKIEEVHKNLNLSDMQGIIGIGHTRWATHGAPAKENAHPHSDCFNEIAIVHNGIIENFIELKTKLENNGHFMKSRTDTEVIAHLIEEEMKNGLGFVDSFKNALKRIKGSYGIAAISVKEPDKIVCARKESPLVIGIGKNEVYVASDIPAFLPFTNKVILLEEEEIAILRANEVKITKLKTNEEVFREPVFIEWTPETAEKQGYPHFMLKEIHEQPLAIKNALRVQRIYFNLAVSKLLSAERIYLISCGTSYNACLAASYAFSKLAKTPTQAVMASEFNELCEGLIDEKSVVLAVSQSGETADTLNAIRVAKAKKALVVSITNVMGSTITRLSDVYIGQNSGPEIGVAATKTFTAQLVILLKLVINLSRKKGTLSNEDLSFYEEYFLKIPDLIQEVLNKQENKVKEIAKKYKNAKSFCFLGRGINVATALEGRLKLLELSYLPSLAYPAGESKHGFIAVIEEGYPTVFIAPKDEVYSKIIGNIMEMKARGAKIIAIIEEDDEEIKHLADDYVQIPKEIPSIFTPIVCVIPLQLLAYYLSVEKGYDPDKPRNLAKSVTVE